MNNKNQIYPKTFIVEFAAIVFLIITIPVWFPIVISVLVGGFGILVIILVIGFIFSSIARSNNLVDNFYMFVSNSDIIYLWIKLTNSTNY